MNLAKISANGQITLPAEIRRALEVKAGDKVLFMKNQNGEIVISKASLQAIYTAQAAFAGVAEEVGLWDDHDVQELVNEVRYKKKKS